MTEEKDSADDLTPVETPEAIKRSKSGELRPGLADCPQCGGTGKIPLGVVAAVAVCSYCEGGGKVTLQRHHEYVGLKSP